MAVDLEKSSFGMTATGVAVDLYTFSHPQGVSLSVSNYGCIITSLNAPDRQGVIEDVVLGYDTLAEYEDDKRFLGCVVGRYANRIANGRFSLAGTDYQLETNPSGHHLHGGSSGFNKQVWTASVENKNDLPRLVLEHHSPHGHGGYPGELACKVTYALSLSGEVEVHYHASSDRPTIVNLTNHSYFNLCGHQHASENSVLNHMAMLNCDTFLPTDDRGIPFSGPVSVNDTPMDFRSETAFGERIHAADQQLQNGKGYDHNWVVNRESSGLALAARVCDPTSGRSIEVATTQPGIQCYTGNNLGGLHGKGGAVYSYRGAVCLETQHYPDSPNQAAFPSTVIHPGEPLHEITVFRLGAGP